MSTSMVPILTVMAEQNHSGKTNLICALMPYLKEAGLRVGVVQNFENDIQLKTGDDRELIWNSGVSNFYLSSPSSTMSIKKENNEFNGNLEAIASQMTDVDLVIGEGFRECNYPKIEIVRRGYNEKVYANKNELLAVMTDMPEIIPAGVMWYYYDEVEDLANLIVEWCKKQK